MTAMEQARRELDAAAAAFEDAAGRQTTVDLERLERAASAYLTARGVKEWKVVEA